MTAVLYQAAIRSFAYGAVSRALLRTTEKVAVATSSIARKSLSKKSRLSG